MLHAVEAGDAPMGKAAAGRLSAIRAHFWAVAALSLTKTSIAMPGVDPVFLKPCGVPFSIKNAWPGVASTGFAEPMVSSRFPLTGIKR